MIAGTVSTDIPGQLAEFVAATEQAGTTSLMPTEMLATPAGQAVQGDLEFALAWKNSGSVIYNLSHSVAAMLTATRAPEVHLGHLPHRAFLISAPSDFLPLPHRTPVKPERSWVGVWRFDDPTASEDGPMGNVRMWSDTDTDCGGVMFHTSIGEEQIPTDNDAVSFACRQSSRLAANVVQYVTEYRQCITEPRAPKAGAPSFVLRNVNLPSDVVIDKAFRDHIKALVSARGIVAARRALQHVVRGHWRNQAVGSGWSERRLTWVRPHRRGDESIGSVVRRIERVNPRRKR